MVAGYTLPQWAAIPALEQDRTCPQMPDHDLDLSLGVYASYIKIDGKIYIRDLENAATGYDTSGKKICYLPPPATIGLTRMYVYVAEDHLGIRKVAFVMPTSHDAWCKNQEYMPGVWWRRISLVDVCTATFYIESDVSTARKPVYEL